MAFDTIRSPISGPRQRTSRQQDGRCTDCSKLRGIIRDGALHLRFTRGHEYLVALPVTCTCRGCGRLNQTSGPSR